MIFNWKNYVSKKMLATNSGLFPQLSGSRGPGYQSIVNVLAVLSISIKFARKTIFQKRNYINNRSCISRKVVTSGLIAELFNEKSISPNNRVCANMNANAKVQPVAKNPSIAKLSIL